MIYSFLLKIVFISGNDVVTPSQLVAALKYFGGLQNSIVELIKLERETVSKLVENFAECDRKLKKIIKRTNDVFFPTTIPQAQLTFLLLRIKDITCLLSLFKDMNIQVDFPRLHCLSLHCTVF
jgi:hypothetical protein